ncbi:MAG: universal stress protein [Syntrophobacterales bacterium]|jgi:nucleotide-binding universal stress UspA family protein
MGKHRGRILLAVDGSDQAFEALRYVSQFFPPKRMEVVLFHVATKVPEGFWDVEKSPAFKHKLSSVAAWATREQTVVQEFMERARQLFLDQGFPEEKVSVKIVERKKGIARDIITESQRGYDAVVVGRLGKSQLKDLVWGNVADKLIGRLTHLPVCVVGGSPQDDKILVAMDTSEEAAKVLDFAGTMMDITDCEVTLFHVIRGLESWTADAGEKLQNAEKAATTLLEEAVGRLERAGLNRERISTKIRSGAASRAEAIVEEARNSGCGTIVMGRRGLSRVKEFFMGRVSKKVLQLAKWTAVWVVS